MRQRELTVHDVRLRRRSFRLDIDKIQVASGFTLLTGPNGVGKSTLLEALTLVDSRQFASVEVDKVPLVGANRRKFVSRIGFAEQQAVLPRAWTVNEYLQTCAQLKGVPSDEISHQCELAAQAMGLMDFRRTLIGRLSGGYRRRTHLAQSLIGDPDVLILDEPSPSLDKEALELLIRDLRNRAAHGTVVIVADHATELFPEATTLWHLDAAGLHASDATT